jgi:hypothetical protein
MIHDILIHALFGGIFAMTGWMAKNAFCEHWYHQLAVGTFAIFLESAILVNVVG